MRRRKLLLFRDMMTWFNAVLSELSFVSLQKSLLNYDSRNDYAERELNVFAKKKIRNVHCLNPFVVTARKIVCHQYLFRIIVVDFKQAVIFALSCFSRLDFPLQLEHIVFPLAISL